MQPGGVVDLTTAIALDAARTSAALGLPMADSVIFASARAFRATLWTQDWHFAETEDVRYVAAKSGST